MNDNTLPANKYANNSRVISGTYLVTDSDSVLLCNTSGAPVVIELCLIPEGRWSTQYKLYVKDNSDNAAVNNITINAPTGYTINGFASYTISQSSQAISIFIASDTNYGIANAVDAPVTNQVSNEPFSNAWDGVTDIAPSKNAVYDKIITIGTGFGNTAYVRTGGDDASAVVGNILLPFKTIGAAITAIGTLANSAIVVDAGEYDLTDENAPFGLKMPGTSYDYFFNTGAVVNYYGTYGMYISGSTTSGSIYGQGQLNNYATSATATVNGLGGYAFNIQPVTGLPKRIRASTIYNRGAGVNLIRVSEVTGANAFVDIDMNFGSIWNFVGGVALRIDGAGVIVNNSTIASSSGNSSTLIINETSSGGPVTKFSNSVIYNWGRFGASDSDYCVEINSNENNPLQFLATSILFAESNGGSILIRYTSVSDIYNNTIYDTCRLRGRVNSSFGSGGNSFNAVNAISIKIIDTYAELATGGAAITNLITTGWGLLIDSAL